MQRRLSEHNKGMVEYTKRYKPWHLIYCESFISLEDAKIREKGLKHFGKAFSLLKSRIKYSLTEHRE